MEEFFSSFLRRAGMPASIGLSCSMIHPSGRQTDGRAIAYTPYSTYGVARNVRGNKVINRLRSWIDHVQPISIPQKLILLR